MTASQDMAKTYSSSHRKRIAIIGAGASGIVAARFLLKHGANVTIYERHTSLGGQWDSLSPYSGVWPAMRTNTCSITTKFSDLAHPQDIPLYPRNQSILQYLNNYATKFHIVPHIRFSTRVTHLDRTADNTGWKITSIQNERTESHDEFDAVIVASGRFTNPYTPEVHGLHSFTGECGVTHSYRYQHPENYKGKRILVTGGSISAFEISTSLVMAGAKHVISSARRIKHLAGRLYQGKSVEYFKHTRYERLFNELISKRERAERLKDFLNITMGPPEKFNSLPPDPDPEKAGFATSETFLPLVAEGYITPKPWISRVTGKTVYFNDGTVERNIDGIIMCTGYDLELPYLSEELQRVIQPTRKHIPLSWYTFHPAVPDLAFIGFWFHSGSVFVSTEQQARFIAYVLCGLQKLPSKRETLTAFEKYMADEAIHGKVGLSTFSYQLSKLGGFEPDLYAHPELARYLLFGPITPASYRLSGIDALTDAPQRIIEDAARFNCMTNGCLTSEEAKKLQQLAKQKNDPDFTAYIKRALTISS